MVVKMRHLRAFCAATFVFFGWVSAALACTNPYIVRAGDSLSAIAASQMGSFLAFESIYRANMDVIGENPDRISVGMRLEMPCVRSAANPVDWSVFPSPDTVARLQRRDEVQILDIRSANAVSKAAVPWSISVPYGTWRGPRGDRSAVPSDLVLSEIIGAAGLRVDQPVVIVHTRPTVMDTGRAALIYWLLKSSGFREIAIMQGGFEAWEAAELPVVSGAYAADPYNAEILFSTKWRADEMSVYGVATAQVAGFLLDARPQNVFAKFDDDGARVGNTLPTARNAPIIPLMAAFEPDVPIETGVQAVVDHMELYEADWTAGDVIIFCQTGELAALTWFYASELASLENILLYPESATGWANRGGQLFVGQD